MTSIPMCPNIPATVLRRSHATTRKIAPTKETLIIKTPPWYAWVRPNNRACNAMPAKGLRLAATNWRCRYPRYVSYSVKPAVIDRAIQSNAIRHCASGKRPHQASIARAQQPRQQLVGTLKDSQEQDSDEYVGGKLSSCQRVDRYELPQASTLAPHSGPNE